MRAVVIMSARGIAKKRQKNVSKSQRANVLFPVGRLHRYMKAGPGTRKLRIGVGAPVYAAAVIEYLTGEPFACLLAGLDLRLPRSRRGEPFLACREPRLLMMTLSSMSV